ncbi:MAG: NifU family protein [Gemmatimonadales bacterium]
MTDPIEITAEPVDETRCKFVLSRPVHDTQTRKYTSQDEAADVPVVQAVLSVPGVCEVVAAGNVLTAVKSEDSIPWRGLTPQVRYAVNSAAARLDTAQVVDTGETEDDDAIFEKVEALFRSQINPTVAQHGGKIELIDVQDATIVVRMMGGCQGCGMANVTLRQGIEASLKRFVPAVKEIKDITDHSSGTNPYFEAGTK